MSDAGEIPGQRLLALCSEEWAVSPRRRMTTFENAMLEECLTLGRLSESSVFKSCFAKAVRASIDAGNPKLARRLLAEEPTSHSTLSEVKDIANIAIRQTRWPGSWAWPTDLKDLQLLVDHGASVSSVDDRGDTPLILACRRGDCELFKFLLEVRAAGEGGLMEQQAIHNPHNLLQVAWRGLLELKPDGTINRFREKNLETTWCGIVMLLLDRENTFSSDEPCLVALLHVACVQRHLAYVRRLLDYGVNINVPVDCFEDEVGVYGSAIHAAARGGHQDIVELLLSRGAKPNEKLACILPFSFRERLWTTSRWKPLLAPLDIILVCGHDLAICEALGTTMGEYQLLLTEVAVEGEIELVKRLLKVGARLDEVPNTQSLEAIRLLRTNGSKVDHGRLRKYAAGCECVEVLRYVVEEFGPALSTDECLAIAQSCSCDPRDMLEFLIKESSLEVNHVFHDTGDNQVTNLLKIACLEFNWRGVTFLLEEGADPTCPGLPETALDIVRGQAANLGPLGFMPRLNYEKVVESLSKHSTTGGLPGDAPTLSESGPPSFQSFNEIPEEVNLDDGHASVEADVINAEREGLLDEGGSPPRARPTEAMSVSDTYGVFEYTAFHDLGAIRIVEIQPSRDGKAFIECRIVHTNLASRPEYEALSYAWGTQTEMGYPSIALNGRKFLVTTNLWSAMHCLRHETETRTMWIDAICINQNHIQERNQQVSLMGDIYRGAKQVLIWLGEEADDSHMVFEQMHITGDGPSSFKGQTLEAFGKICCRPWFYRTWVLQEIALSKTATVVCGRDTKSMKKFLPEKLPDQGFHPLQGRDAIHHFKELGQLRAGVGRASKVLACAMFCNATDLKDKVYGLLGMLDHLDIQVDYNLDISTIFQNFTRAIIQTEGLHILHQYGTQRLLHDLPTWVQDYSIMSPVGAISGGSNTRRAGNCDYILTEIDGSTSIWSTSTYPDRIMPGLEFRGNALVIRGKRLERIKAAADELCANVEYAPGTNKFRQVLRGWETLATELLKTKRFPHTVSQAFLETLTVEDYDVMRNSASESWDDDWKSALWGWYRQQVGTGVLTRAENDHLKENGHPALWPDVLDTKGIYRSDVAEINDLVTHACYGRKLFITHEGSMGLAAPRAQANDQVVFLPGGRYPFVLRPRDDGDWSMMGDCYLYDFNAYKLFEDSARIVETFVIR